MTQWWACVQNLSVNNDNKVKIIEEGGIRAIISLLSVQDLALQEHGVGGPHLLALLAQKYRQIRTQKALLTSTKVQILTEKAVRSNPQPLGRRGGAQCNGLRGTLTLLALPLQKTQILTPEGQATQFTCFTGTKVQIVRCWEQGGLPPLISLLRSKSPAVQVLHFLAFLVLKYKYCRSC